MTEAQASLAGMVAAALGADKRIRSVWLYGSLGRGDGDAWSDVDLVAEVHEADRAGCLADYRRGQPGMPPMILAMALYGRILAATTPDWERFDISFVSPTELAGMDGGALKPLRGERTLHPEAHSAQPDHRAGERVEAMVIEFLRILGLLPVAVGRGEWLVAQQGDGLQRRLLIDLMVEENGVPPSARGGAKKLNAFLTPEQRAVLEALRPPAAQPGAVIDAAADLARLFLARARPLVDRLGATWPAAFEQATRRHLQTTMAFSF
ncbi:nucleotidyltransferase domain-containing protein [Phenylobacterium sp.]|uniref:nucleotidyltransferase domain-containing protein n=1 Tax=Phenylobacterium sp. TaxID=1871053 RepID=UPI00273430AC|nr:nucleotidyltransferase domain-containing protein [Phenylobacterium sp.]MDP3632990.1 nucleotidyltransferase domain-containing protein [Phenylobacterium sp.]HQT53744.1 nucleotidyltransferase domain-containing protein [Phenylobacterium sp.]